MKQELVQDWITRDQEASVGDAAQIMLEKKFSGLPALNEAGQLIDITAESDIFRLVAREWSKT